MGWLHTAIAEAQFPLLLLGFLFYEGADGGQARGAVLLNGFEYGPATGEDVVVLAVEGHDVEAGKQAFEFLHGVAATIELHGMGIAVDNRVQCDSALVKVRHQPHHCIYKNRFSRQEHIENLGLVITLRRHIQHIVQLRALL